MKNIHKINQNIYITNSEEIKEGGWCINIENNLLHWVNEYKDNSFLKNCKKIVLTTDQSLDGVQAIDDDFLKWFVKNPGCEEVEIETFEVEDYVGFAGHTGYPTFHNEYKIIIPKEEPKQETLEEAKIKHTKFCIENNIENPSFSFDKGAKWQQEQDKNKYSEEDMIDFGKYLLQLSNSVMSKKFNMKMLDSETGIKLTKDLFEQFKKK